MARYIFRTRSYNKKILLQKVLGGPYGAMVQAINEIDKREALGLLFEFPAERRVLKTDLPSLELCANV